MGEVTNHSVQRCGQGRSLVRGRQPWSGESIQHTSHTVQCQRSSTEVRWQSHLLHVKLPSPLSGLCKCHSSIMDAYLVCRNVLNCT